MAISKMTDDVSIISKLGDNPNTDNGLSAEALKAKFDEAALLIKAYLNNKLVPSVQNMETSLSETTDVANTADQAASAAMNAASKAQSTADDAKQAASAAVGMKREFNTFSTEGYMEVNTYTTPGSLSKFYSIAIEISGNIYTLFVDWAIIQGISSGKVNDSATFSYAVASASGGIGRTGLTAQINENGTVTFTVPTGQYIRQVVGYY